MPGAPVTLSPGQDRLRAEVREFLARAVGMTIPAQYGGHGPGPAERFIVAGELLAAAEEVSA
jgi:hypothetical protein